MILHLFWDHLGLNVNWGRGYRGKKDLVIGLELISAIRRRLHIVFAILMNGRRTWKITMGNRELFGKRVTLYLVMPKD